MLELVLSTVSLEEAGAFSVLVDERTRPLVTVERTFENLRVVIPEGTWPCTRTVFHRGGYPTFEIHVPGHDRVLFHRGNVETESLGCVLVGRRFGVVKGAKAVLESRLGFKEFMARLEGIDEFELRVIGRAA